MRMSISEMANKLHEYDQSTKSMVLYSIFGALENMEENNRLTEEIHRSIEHAYETGIKYGNKLD